MNTSVGESDVNWTSVKIDSQEPHRLNNTYEKLGQDIPILILYSFTTILGLFGNSIVCYVVFHQRLMTTTYVLIGNLAISDILGSITIPGQWLLCSHYMIEEYGDRSCGLMKSSQILSYYVSTLTMTVIAFDRYRIVHYPLSTRMRPLLPIAVIWIISTICVVPTVVSMRLSEYFTANRLIYCRIAFPSQIEFFSNRPFRKFRVTFVIVTQYLIPLTISIILYAFSIKKIISRKRIGAVTEQQSNEFYKSKRRTIKMLTIALLAFTMAWMPVHLIHFVDFYITPLLPNNCNSSMYYLFFYWLAISTCCFNPFIYCYLNNDFQTVAKKVIFCDNSPIPSAIQSLIHTKSSRQSSNTGSSIFYINYDNT